MTEFFVLDWDQRETIVGHVQDSNRRTLANKYVRGFMLAKDDLPTDLSVQVEVGPDRYPDYFTLQQTPVVSARFVAALKSAGVDNFELFPAPIVEAERTISGHSVMNIIGRVSCLDETRTVGTKVDPDDEVLFRIKKLAIDGSRAGHLDLFRINEFELIILVSTPVRDRLLSQALDGVSLQPAEGWSDSVWF